MPRALVLGSVLVLACALGVPAFAPSAAAQDGPPPSQQRWDSLRGAGTSLYHLRTQWTPSRAGRSADITLQTFSSDFRPLSKAARVYRGPAARAELATRDDAVAVLLYRGGGQGAFVRAVVRPVAPPGGRARSPQTLELTRPAGTGWAPTNATLCPSPDGFTLLWQEESTTGDTSGGHRARSFMARVSPDGRMIDAPHEVAIPWGFGAIAWNGHGYHVALYYDGSAAGQTRLNLVTITPQGQPEQHPWWISDPQAVDEVHLVPSGTSMVVVYRGGADGTTVRSLVSTAVGQWGGAAPPTRDLGRLDAGIPFTERVGATPDAIELVSPPSTPPSG